MLTVPRTEFVAWTQGIIMKRIGNKIIAPNEIECEQAIKSLKNGEPVALTMAGRIISTIKFDPVVSAYIEKGI